MTCRKTQMALDDVLEAIGEEASRATLAPQWAASESFPEAAFFDDPQGVAATARFCGLDPAAVAAVTELQASLAASPELSRLLRHLLWIGMVSAAGRPPLPVPLPTFESTLGEHGCCIYLLAALAWAHLLKAHHRRLGIPEEVTRDTCRQVACFLGNHRRAARGRPGIHPPQFLWLRTYLHGNVYVRLGRFEYWLRPYDGETFVCREKTTGRSQTLAADALNFDRDGFALDGAAVPPERAWTSSLSIGPDAAEGHPANPDGSASREKIRLGFDAWEPFLMKGTPVLDLHIPAGGGMEVEAALDSFRRAKAFFARYFPDRRPAAIACQSWIFNPQLPEILPPAANLVRLQQRVHLCPLHSSPADGLWFIFFMTPFDLATAPRETSLQRAVAGHLAAGRRWRSGGMYLPMNEIPS